MARKEKRGKSKGEKRRENAQDNREIDEERTKGRIAFVDGSGHCHNAGGSVLQGSFGPTAVNKECLHGHCALFVEYLAHNRDTGQPVRDTEIRGRWLIEFPAAKPNSLASLAPLARR